MLLSLLLLLLLLLLLVLVLLVLLLLLFDAAVAAAAAPILQNLLNSLKCSSVLNLRQVERAVQNTRPFLLSLFFFFHLAPWKRETTKQQQHAKAHREPYQTTASKL